MIKNILLSFLFFLLSVNAEKIKMYVQYTDSHEKMMRDYFLPSIKDDFELIIEKHNQRSKTGHYGSPGYNDTMIDKVNLILRAIKENWGKIFIFSDVDIQFFKKCEDDILKNINGKEIIFQCGILNRSICAGFFACKASAKTKKLFENVLLFLKQNPQIHDQGALTILLIHNKYPINWGYLPVEYWNPGIINGKRWDYLTHKSFDLPNNIIMHHACYCVGIDNKLKQLEIVRSLLKSN